MLYLGKAAAKLYVEEHREKGRKHFGVENTGTRNYSPAGLCMCVSVRETESGRETPVLCKITDFFKTYLASTS